jgi:hypothetical protein
VSAIISTDGVYRYRLERKINVPGLLYKNPEARPLAFCMLNPSTADAEIDDPTIRRCIGFAEREGANSLIVVNVYALRSTDPQKLWLAVDPVGPLNFDHIHKAAVEAGRVIVAWGVNAKASDVENAMFELRKSGAKVLCLGTTKAGHPRHPLYVKKDQPLIPWSLPIES